MAVAPCASSDIAVLLGSESLASSSAAVRGTADPDEGPRGEGQGTLLQVMTQSTAPSNVLLCLMAHANVKPCCERRVLFGAAMRIALLIC